MNTDFGIDIIMDYVGRENFIKGKNYFPFYVRFVGTTASKTEKLHFFRVNSEREPITYSVKIRMEGAEIVESTCTCPQFDIEGCCKHIAASLYNYREELFPISEEEQKLMVSKAILEDLYKNRTVHKVGVKKQVHLEIYLEFLYRKSELSVVFKIGENKLYNLNSKLSQFIRVYKSEGSLLFGKDFIYDTDTNFFAKEDETIIDYLIEYDKRAYYSVREVKLDGEDIWEFLQLVRNRELYYLESESQKSYRRVRAIEERNPYKFSLSKENGFYTLKLEDRPHFLMNDACFTCENDVIYKLPSKIATVFYSMENHEMNELTFREDDLEKFVGGMLPVIKENVSLDESVQDVVVVGVKPIPKLYLDFKRGLIILNVKFDYNGEVVDSFEENEKIVRDYEVEMEVLKSVTASGFLEGDKFFYLDDMDLIGDFLENELDVLAGKYEIFSSQRIKSTNFLKDNHIKSSFGIGKDNILRYEFDFGGIANEEIVDILETLKRKKKYYRLKSGDFLNLEENTDLQELERLVDAMDLSDGDLKEGTGEIPKYRAVYLDSLKKDKYHIISTNNLFDELIGKFNSYKDATVDFAKKDEKILRDYQQTGVRWLYNVYKCGFGGILADEMGLGKSIQLICFIKEILKEKPETKVLIVAPTSLIYNWKNEFDKFGSEISYKVFAENKEARKHDFENLDGVSVLITTYGLVRRDKEEYEKIEFELIAIDEAQNIKNTNAQMTKVVKSLKASTKVALTGTPLENSVMELWSIFDFIMPGYLAGMLTFQRKYNIKDVDEEHLKHLDSLNKQIAPFILRRKKKDVVKELPDKIENNIFIDLNDEQKKLYAAQLEKTKKEIDEVIAEEGFEKANFKILQLLMKLRQLCIDPSIIYEDYKGGSAKIENLVSITKDIIENGHKILLFTSFKTALDIVNREFTNAGISTYVIDGSVSAKKRMELVDKFNSDDTNVFLITLKSGGTGLNLTSADVVIHLDLWWNPQVENQATDRAHRIGQKNTVEVIKLICKGTIEERILELQNKKKVLSDKLIEGENRDQNIISKLSEKDIKNLLSLDNDESED